MDTSARSYEQAVEKLKSEQPVPAIWLFGKTGSGKSSIVRFLTGAEEATVGEGYRPETKTSRCFDFPDSKEPLLRFVDTRGLAEASYDPSEDIERFSGSTQLVIVTVRIADHSLDQVIEPLRQVRASAPQRPVLLVLTCLHEVMGTVDLSDGPDPFEERSGVATSIPDTLRVLIDRKKKQFDRLFDSILAIDLTPMEDGFADPEFGGKRLKAAILEKMPHAYRQALLAIEDTGANGQGDPMSQRQKRSRLQVLGSSAMAGTAGAVPMPWVDIPAVVAIQAHLAIKIARIYEQEITPARWAVLSGAAGSRIAIRMALRETLKFIPFVGMAASAASSFAFTYALGMSWDWYFADLRKGNVPDPEQLKVIFAEQLKRGHRLWNA
ncbi:hypothetical protein Q31b_07310 [Novipirellula aureliae]|uniref:G domain-containing protein n=1 Tax=Novipirellula aureliae TaxID=2527966 RepID=A0A5C6EDC0_9BACT|nr:GTPase [Novipirellula aureliae]TWU45556.1 hypothetical protein Q31b_07310 [Novipirellula aureliae]